MDLRKLASLSVFVAAAAVSMADHPAPLQDGWHLTNSAAGPVLVLDASATSISKRVNVRANAAALRAEEIDELYATFETIMTGCLSEAQAAQLSAPPRVRVTVNPDEATHDPFEGEVRPCTDGNFVAWPATNAHMTGCAVGADCVFSFDVTVERLDVELGVPVELAWNAVGGVNGPLETAPLGADVQIEIVDLP